MNDDAVVSDDIKNGGPAADATINFAVTASGTVRVSFPVTSERDARVVGLGVHRKSGASLTASD